MKVLAVVHSADAGPELFEEVVAAEGHELAVWEIPAQGSPVVGDADAVMVFGGDQNVGEEVKHPWLHEEYDALRRWVEDGTPVLGVCLGAQTLAHAFGGRVTRAPRTFFGFFETSLTDAGAADPVLGVLPPRFEAFNANAYTFEIPPGATVLAEGPVPQAFRLRDRAWAVQFHPEIRRENVAGWFEGDPTLQPREEIAAQLDEKLPRWQELGRTLCRAFLASAR
ncbi:MAG TPA: type 1 glutamine amidotransferase [Gaiellaceae bacterium]|nr:type 1 glutamine amidotransferase [Gaiellaceae bacterium]